MPPYSTILLGYLLGSIPFGLLLTRAAGLGDIRAIGSGNIGATNVLRTGRKGLAAATLLLDGMKGAAAVLLGRWLAGHDAAMWAGLGAVARPSVSGLARFQGRQGCRDRLRRADSCGLAGRPGRRRGLAGRRRDGAPSHRSPHWFRLPAAPIIAAG